MVKLWELQVTSLLKYFNKSHVTFTAPLHSKGKPETTFCLFNWFFFFYFFRFWLVIFVNVFSFKICCAIPRNFIISNLNVFSCINCNIHALFLFRFYFDRHYGNTHGKSNILTSGDLTSFMYQVARGMDYLSSRGVSIIFKMQKYIIFKLIRPYSVQTSNSKYEHQILSKKNCVR